jgi:uncharacterized membrane protein YkoI
LTSIKQIYNLVKTKQNMSRLFVPNEILRVFKQLYPQLNPAEIAWKWEVPGKIYEASFESEGAHYEVEITVTGHHLLTEKKVKNGPNVVLDAVKSKYPKHKIDDASLVTFSNGDVYYEVDIISPAKEKESEVLVREDGKFVMKGEDL